MATTPASRTEGPFLARLRGTSLLLVSGFIYLASVFGICYTLDIAYYQQEKWAIIAASSTSYLDRQLLQGFTTSFTAYAEQGALDSTPLLAKEQLLERSRAAAEELLTASPSATLITLEDGENIVLAQVARLERVSDLQNFSNSLFDRSFNRSIQRQFTTRNSDKVVARFRIFFTSPPNNAEVRELTRHYWKLIIVCVTVISLIFWLLIRSILVPLQRVTVMMQRREAVRAAIILRPGTLIERAYNDLARDAALTRFSKELRERISRGGYSYAEPVLEQAPALVQSLTGLDRVALLTFARRGPESAWKNEHAYPAETPSVPADQLSTELLRLLGEADPVTHPEYWAGRIHAWNDDKGVARPFLVNMLKAHPEELWLLIVHCPEGAAPFNAWWVDFLGRLAMELRYALNSIEEQRRLILQEKSKANISLSRNLGHDLTNIIATSKIELMTIRTCLSLPPAEIQGNPRKEAIFRESLEALLNNTRFLQEIVNLYRSFSFLQKPTFESCSLSDLVADTVNLYKLSLSKDFVFAMKLATDLPQVRVEPRLLRLALFNLLNNATEALRRTATNEKPGGTITLYTGLAATHRHVEIIVEDTGPGIRDADGALMSPDAIPGIFRLGFSTKKDQEGEGLGLNWVQSIVREFHGGEIAAWNREKGGACFAIRLPLEPTSGTAALPERDRE